jgi:hypothetical protein
MAGFANGFERGKTTRKLRTIPVNQENMNKDHIWADPDIFEHNNLR